MAFKNRLTARSVATAIKDVCDGSGLWLQITPTLGGKSWLLRYRFDGRARQLGLGSALTTSLSEARKRAQEARDMIARRIDPREARDAARAERMASVVKRKTFEQCFRDYIETNRHEWRSAKHAAQWEASLKHTTALNPLEVSTIEKAHVLDVLKPIWLEKTETASRIRSRIEMVLDYATNAGFRQGDNPARLEGLKGLLPAKAKIVVKAHHAALDYREASAFMTELRARQDVSARALEFIILNASRVGEVLGARWREIDLDAGLWRIPAERMKGSAEHVIPLAPRAVAILEGLRSNRAHDALIFPGQRSALSNQTIRNVLLALRPGLTAHGFRSTFRDWCGDQTNFPREVAEAALAHKVGNTVEAAYRRGSALEKRRKLMQAWADYCAKPPATSRSDNVVAIGAGVR
ncbi:MAG TPA: integrase arm-type DNA-binding domain-containing protein [Roseiarcus sp.]|nr:integrase arm-type DNA-binding domain-containing protein [Roseiarcus sp.]